MLTRKKNQKGFTLVELLIVVVILGILAAVAIPRFLTTRDEAQLRTCQANMAAINSAVEEFCFAHNIKADKATGVLDFTDCDDAAVTNVASLYDTLKLLPSVFPDGEPMCPAHTTTDLTHLYSLQATGRAACGTGTGGDDTGHGTL